jgi:hypothetical protein
MDITTRIIDADIIINGKSMPVLNSDLSLMLKWSIFIIKNDESADLDIKITSLSGSFNVTETKECYKKEIKYTINELIEWNTEVTPTFFNLQNVNISPEHITINFDTQQLKIKF